MLSRQQKVNSNIIQLSKESIQEGSFLSCDGAFTHYRNSSQYLGAFMNCKPWKIVAGSVITKERKNGNFVGSSNIMESEMIWTIKQEIYGLVRLQMHQKKLILAMGSTY